MSQRPLWKRAWYSWLRVLCRLALVLLCRIRVRGQQYLPASGGVLVLSNHQSHLDPVLVGLGFKRRMNFVARDTLFGFTPFRWLIESLDAIPLDREGMGLSGLKETMKRLKRGEIVLLFPEGTRTRDGEVGRIKPGFCVLAKKVKVPLLPVGVEGSFQAWPRTRLLPVPTTINVQIGKPIMPEEVAKLSDEQLIAEVQRRLKEAHAAAREGIRRSRWGHADC